MRLLWSGRPVSHRGRFFDFRDVELHAVRPAGRADAAGQAGGPPIIVSGRRIPAMRRAARLGDGWMPYLVSPGAYARSVQAVRDEARSAGRDLGGFEWMLYLYTSIREDGDRARADVATFLQGAYGHLEPEKLQRIAPAGTPEEVAQRGTGVRRCRRPPRRRLTRRAVGHPRGGPAGRRRGPAPDFAAGPGAVNGGAGDGDVFLPCAGLSVVEVAVGTSDLGLGLVAGVPGMILADLGASVTRVVGAAPDIDARRALGPRLAP